MSHDVNPDMLNVWCEQFLHAAPVRTLFKGGHLSTVIGLELSDGQQIVVKIRVPSKRLTGCVEVQRHFCTAGFPCPKPLAGPAAFGEFTATAEEFVAGGEQLPIDADSPQLFAQGLANLIALSPSTDSVASLEPPPPWIWWQHNERGIWPKPDDRVVDLNAHREPEWLDRIGKQVRDQLTRCTQQAVIGHSDWISQNVAWKDKRIHVVHDWDSVAALPEAALVGTASAVFPANGEPLSSATVEQSVAFMEAYEIARGRKWADDESKACWAAGLWVRCFDAKKEASSKSPFAPQILSRLASEIESRLRRAGIS